MIEDKYYDTALMCLLKLDKDLDIIKNFIEQNAVKSYVMHRLDDYVECTLRDIPFFDCQKNYGDIFGPNIKDIRATKNEKIDKDSVTRLITFKLDII